MSFQWPWVLVLLLLLPLWVWVYRRSLRRPAEAVVLYPDLARLRRAVGARGVQRHIPALLFLGALLLALLALARPSWRLLEADPRAGIILAVDISRSMQATDVWPSRFEAARSALRTFVRELPRGARVGLVTFSRNATLVVPLTTDRTQLQEAIDLLQLDLGTAIGEAIVESVSALPSLKERSDVPDPKSLATIILLTDGRSLGGIDPLLAAEQANQQQIRIDTIGIGRVTDGPVPGLPEGYQVAAAFDPETLRSIAQITGGEYVSVDSLSKLQQTYRSLSQKMVWKTHRDEVSGLFALGAGVLLMLSLGLSQLRRRVV
ncbi:vWA domain-containing protein [Meiothermus granaticius]|uniref:VWFA-related Acidobacterial domain protein n=1 Tax=Meiothermus granaticius NBRC 107808 TaxID=1227551 RepID=A0A399F9N2_9DEIN|nr:VWA domain-containing protein [Meiothermus granaticius]MCL6527438.1 VWA domain-containing protein [Thermaceae bacterium]RIH92396.1 VWFA-related Acidobacterial domain protein [Meiothermus granaticius NBRC 107808]GEM87431.1 hypothetical protein MGR01S_20560 [Meiothermus granaticius NBRC 107808]